MGLAGGGEGLGSGANKKKDRSFLGGGGKERPARSDVETMVGVVRSNDAGGLGISGGEKKGPGMT